MNLWNRTRFEDDRLAFFRSMAALTEAGFTVDEALGDALDGTLDKNLRAALETVRSEVCSGIPLSRALARHPSLAGAVETALIRSGEASGQLAGALDATAVVCEERQELRMELAAALIYPALVLILASVALLFLTRSVIPGLAELYTASGRSLPLFTRLVSLLALIIPLSMIALTAVFFGLRRTPPDSKTAQVLTRFPNRIPLIRNMLEAHHTALWSSITARLLETGSTLVDALRLAAMAMPAETAGMLVRIASRLQEGIPAGTAFRSEKNLPPLSRRLIDSGDRSGDLIRAMRQISGLYRVRYASEKRRVIALVEPAAIVLAGSVILILALGVILPAIDLGALIE